MTVRLGDGVDLAENGRVSFVNQPALDSGVKRGMPVREAARLMLAYDAAERAAADVTNRTVMAQNAAGRHIVRSEEHTSELQSLMRISYDVFCLIKKNINSQSHT